MIANSLATTLKKENIKRSGKSLEGLSTWAIRDGEIALRGSLAPEKVSVYIDVLYLFNFHSRNLIHRGNFESCNRESG